MSEDHEVVIIDIKMPFSSMVVFILKWTMAAILAWFIMLVVPIIVILLLTGGLPAIANFLNQHHQ